MIILNIIIKSIFLGDGEVHLYSSSSSSIFTYIKTMSWSDHFGTSDITSLDDVLYTSSDKQYVINGDEMYIISSDGKVESLFLSNNGNKNVYRSINFQERPSFIASACEIDSVTHAFTNSSLFLFDFTTTKWTNYGRTYC